MKRMLGIVGSPRRGGNTYVLVSALLEGAREAGAETDLLFLADTEIRECDGCHACWKSGRCAKKDDMTTTGYGGLAGSDVLVFGTPVYWYGPTALMKGLIDRMVFFNSPLTRPQIKGKGTCVVIPFEEVDPATVAPVTAFFEKCFAYLEMPLMERLIVPGVTRRGEVKEKRDVLEEASRMGRRLAAG
jgi:multimeric flavodoxin WrbA